MSQLIGFNSIQVDIFRETSEAFHLNDLIRVILSLSKLNITNVDHIRTA
jgi:hypothetical protein